ncbi:MAG: DUF3102 domain-containing protein [Planctomycetaceae bacterium]|nr:DUF3102 domain-containing protein [Planctomycetaceae bacterium]
MPDSTPATPDGNGLSRDAAAEIVQLHGEIEQALRTSLDKAMRIGELLADVKATLPHGQFGTWCDQHLPFTARTATNYMRLHKNRDRLKSETVSDLGAAYGLLASPKPITTESALSDPIGVLGNLVIPTLHAPDLGDHLPEDWEPGPRELRIGFVPDGRMVLVESLPDHRYVRTLVIDSDHGGMVYDKRGINRHWLRTALDRGHNIDPLAVEWREPMPATSENNPAADVLPEWKYEVAA